MNVLFIKNHKLFIAFLCFVSINPNTFYVRDKLVLRENESVCFLTEKTSMKREKEIYLNIVTYDNLSNLGTFYWQ